MIRTEVVKAKSELLSTKFELLVQKKLDALVVTDVLPNTLKNDYESKLNNLSNASNNVIKHKNLTIYPLSYAVIHQKNDEVENDFLLSNFFKESKIANQNYPNLLGDKVKKNIDETLNLATNYQIKLLQKENFEFPALNVRCMQPAANYAIEIHCENSFVSQLNKTLKNFLLEKVDLMDAISFYTMLQKPEIGGDLILFDKNWDETPVEAGNLDEKTRKNEKLFFNSSTEIPHKRIQLNQGDMVFFRAAQIWHCIDEVKGSKPRITAGGFLAAPLKGDSKYFYWS